MKRRRGRREAKSHAPVDPLTSLFEQLAESKPAASPATARESGAPVVRVAERVERLAYTRTQAAAALGISPATFARRVLPLIETLEMPWGTLLVPVDELERLAAERSTPGAFSSASGKPRAVDRHAPPSLVARISA